MGGKGSFVVLLIIVAVLTFALAVMASYLFFVAGNPTSAQIQYVNTNVGHEPTRVPSAELSSKKLFEEKKFFNLKAVDDKTSVIQLGAEIVYYKKVKGIKVVEEKIAGFETKMKESIGTYFQNMTLEQVKDPKTKEKANTELIKQLNDLLSSDEEKHYDIIYDIIFEDWFYQ